MLATELYDIASKINKDADDAEYAKIVVELKKAAHDGKYSIRYTCDMSSVVYRKLEADGFRIFQNSLGSLIYFDKLGIVSK